MYSTIVMLYSNIPRLVLEQVVQRFEAAQLLAVCGLHAPELGELSARLDLGRVRLVLLDKAAATATAAPTGQLVVGLVGHDLTRPRHRVQLGLDERRPMQQRVESLVHRLVELLLHSALLVLLGGDGGHRLEHLLLVLVLPLRRLLDVLLPHLLDLGAHNDDREQHGGHGQQQRREQAGGAAVAADGRRIAERHVYAHVARADGRVLGQARRGEQCHAHDVLRDEEVLEQQLVGLVGAAAQAHLVRGELRVAVIADAEYVAIVGLVVDSCVLEADEDLLQAGLLGVHRESGRLVAVRVRMHLIRGRRNVVSTTATTARFVTAAAAAAAATRTASFLAGRLFTAAA